MSNLGCARLPLILGWPSIMVSVCQWSHFWHFYMFLPPGMHFGANPHHFLLHMFQAWCDLVTSHRSFCTAAAIQIAQMLSRATGASGPRFPLHLAMGALLQWKTRQNAQAFGGLEICICNALLPKDMMTFTVECCRTADDLVMTLLNF